MDSNQTESGLKTDDISLFPKKPKKNYCLIISLVIGAIILIGGIIALIVVLTRKKRDDSPGTPIENVNITYSKNELKFFDIRKNIFSTIYGENENKEENSTFYYECVFGIKNKSSTLFTSNNKLFVFVFIKRFRFKICFIKCF